MGTKRPKNKKQNHNKHSVATQGQEHGKTEEDLKPSTLRNRKLFVYFLFISKTHIFPVIPFNLTLSFER